MTSSSIDLNRTSGGESFESSEESEQDFFDGESNLGEDVSGVAGSWNKSYSELPEQEERKLHLKVKEMMKHEIRRIYLEARSKQEIIRKRFGNVIGDARSALIAARIEAEKVSITRLEEKAGERQAEILKNRTSRVKKNQLSTNSAKTRATTLKYIDTSKILAEEIGTLRKIQADLDRARARRKFSVAAAVNTKHGKAKVMNLFQTEVRRLEKDEDVYELVDELRELDLNEHADKLLRAMYAKQDSERRLRQKLSEERTRAQENALRKVEEEKQKLRREIWNEKEREERERIEREKMEKIRLERERLKRMMVNLKRKARNMEMQRSFESATINTSFTKSFCYSYFKTLPK